MSIENDRPVVSDVKSASRSDARDTVSLDGAREELPVPLPPIASAEPLITSATASRSRQNFVDREGAAMESSSSDDVIKTNPIDTESAHYLHRDSFRRGVLPADGSVFFLSTLPKPVVVFLCGFFFFLSVICATFGFLFLRPSHGEGGLSLSELSRMVSSGIGSFVSRSVLFYRQLAVFGVSSVSVVQETSSLSDTLLEYVLEGRGNELIAHVERLHDLFTTLSEQSKEFSTSVASVSRMFLPAGLDDLSVRFSLDQYGVFIESMLAWLRFPSDHHIAVLLQNPAEIRPTGGFIGSYVDVVVRGGRVVSATVHDISDVDRVLPTLTVPPAPLQAIVSNWRTADSNWFAHFPDSAARTIQFLEASDLYRSQGVTFDGVVAVNASVISDVLALTGPLSLSEAQGDTVTRDNFLSVIQKSVQSAQAKKDPHPKFILERAAPVFVAQLKKVDRAQLKALVGSWIVRRDVMVYMKDAHLQKFLDSVGVTGRQFEIPSSFNGEYLSLVVSNIGGQKSDLFMKQRVLSQIRLTDDGTISNHVVVAREHTATDKDEWWYRAQNQVYVQAYTPAAVKLVSASGAWGRTVPVKVTAASAGYSTDPLVRDLESSLRVFPSFPEVSGYRFGDKNIFAFWMKTDRGTTSEVSFDYTHDALVTPADGVVYDFVIERQPGVPSSYAIEISAPLGYIWRQNHLPVYEYSASDAPARTVLSLALQKL